MRPNGFANILDRASTELLRMEEENRLPEGLQVHPDMYEMMAEIRRRELNQGFPLLVLGLPVAPRADLGSHEYRLVR